MKKRRGSYSTPRRRIIKNERSLSPTPPVQQVRLRPLKSRQRLMLHQKQQQILLNIYDFKLVPRNPVTPIKNMRRVTTRHESNRIGKLSSRKISPWSPKISSRSTAETENKSSAFHFSTPGKRAARRREDIYSPVQEDDFEEHNAIITPPDEELKFDPPNMDVYFDEYFNSRFGSESPRERDNSRSQTPIKDLKASVSVREIRWIAKAPIPIKLRRDSRLDSLEQLKKVDPKPKRPSPTRNRHRPKRKKSPYSPKNKSVI